MELTMSHRIAAEVAEINSRQEHLAFARAERRLNARPRLTFNQIKSKWEDNARLHATWILDQRLPDTYSKLYNQTLCLLERMNSDPENVLYGRGQEVFEAYAAVLNERVPAKNREVYPPLRRFGEPKEVLHRF